MQLFSKRYGGNKRDFVAHAAENKFEVVLIGTGGPSVCWIDHKTTPFDNLYRGMEKESRKSHPKGREIVEQK